MSMDPTPTTPVSPGNRPRPHSRGISFRSDRSRGSEERARLAESPREKAQRDSIWKGHSKSNPNAAINEAQPGVANITEESTLQNLRSLEHRDSHGHVIADPDRSNPTRPRMERPLDTIRSFERAIDDGYRKRTSYMRQDSEQWDKENQFASRRNSYFGGYENGPSPNRSVQNGGGGGYYGGPSHYNGGGPPRPRYPANRMQSDPQLYGQKPYPQHSYHQSYDTVNTGGTNGSDSTGPWANSTDPSSENSSIDRVHAMNKPPTPMDQHNGYANNGYHGTIMEEHGAGMYGDYWHGNGNGQPNHPQRDEYNYGQPNGYPPARDMYARSNSTPQLQQPQPSQARRPIPLGGTPANNEIYYNRPPANLPPQTQTRKEQPEKRRSWLMRRFSKKG